MNDIIIRREHIAQLGILLTSGGLMSTILGIVWLGQIGTIVIISAVIMLVGIALWAIATPQEFMDFVRGRQTREGTVAIISTFILIGIVTLVYIIVQRQVIVADMTVDQRFTLSDETMTLMERAKRSPRPIEITAFYYAQDIIQQTVDDQYFQLYEAATDGQIRRRYVDPNEQPGFAERYLPLINEGINVFLSYLNEDGTVDITTSIPVARTNSQERDMTQGISQLLTAGQFKVYFELGLETLDPINNEQQGMSVLNNLLTQNGFITEPLSLLQLSQENRPIPQDASALVIASPRRDMSEAEIAIVSEYLDSGGALFIAADIFFAGDVFLEGDSPFNTYLWDNYGIRMTDMIVVDPASSGATAIDVIGAAVFTENSIGTNLNVEGRPETGVQFTLARAIEINDDPPVLNGRVVMSSPLSWGETNYQAVSDLNQYEYDEEDDTQGPLTLVAWAFNEDTNAKIVLVGDGGFVSNGQSQTPQGNGLLFLNSIGWMTGFTQAVEFAPRGFLTAPLLFISGEQLDNIAFFTVIVMPGAMFLIAGWMAFRRYRQN